MDIRRAIENSTGQHLLGELLGHPTQRGQAQALLKKHKKNTNLVKKKGLDDTMELSLCCCCCFDIYNVCLVSFKFSVPVSSRHPHLMGLQSTPIQTLQNTHLRFNPYHRDLSFHNMHLSPPIVVEQELCIAHGVCNPGGVYSQGNSSPVSFYTPTLHSEQLSR